MQTVVARRVGKNREEDASPNTKFLQGTIEPRIMNIGGLKESFSIEAPFLIGGGSSIDGRVLLFNQVQNVLKRKGGVLPLLENVSISVAGESDSSISFQLRSDGNPYNSPVLNIQDSKNPPSVLNPLTSTPTREAKWFDFRVQFGPFRFFILEAKIDFKTLITEKYFLGGVNNSSPTSSDPPRPNPYDSPTSNPYNFGTQFPWLAVSGVELRGSGKAAALLSDKDCNPFTDSIQPPGFSSPISIDKYFTDSSTAWSTAGSDAPGNSSDPAADATTNNIMVNFDPWSQTDPNKRPEVTLQCPGYTNTTSQSVIFEIYKANVACSDASYPGGSGGSWVNLFADPSSGTPLFNFTKSIINKTDFSIDPDMITVDFDFVVYIASTDKTTNCYS
jgi:hypothetical protein